MKGMFDSGQNTMKDLAFMANSGGIDTTGFQQFSEDSLSALSAGIQQILGNNNTIIGGAGGALARVFNLAGDVVKGNNVIIPNTKPVIAIPFAPFFLPIIPKIIASTAHTTDT